jgi:integrase
VSSSGLWFWEGLCEVNPVVSTNDPSAGIKSRDRTLTDHELRAIWHACRDDDFGRIVRLLVISGCRRSEIGGLKWNEIDLDNQSRHADWRSARPLRRALRLRRLIGADIVPFSELPPRPRRWHTRPARSWDHIIREIKHCENEVLGAIAPVHAAVTARWRKL